MYNCENFDAPFYTSSKTKLQKIQERKRRNTFVGTPLYVAPEMLRNTESGAFTDFWTLGVIIYEMAFGVTPFLAESDKKVYDNILTRQFQFPDTCTDESLMLLIDELLQLEPQRRLGMQGH